MGWEKDYERWRDMGHTWGPGIDDRREPTPEEIAENEAQRKAYEEKIASVRVEPRENVRLAGEKLTNIKVPYAMRQQYSDARLVWAKNVAKSLGYELKLLEWKDREPDKFMVDIEYYGYISERGGNIHKFAVSNIDNIKDCLQLVADFSALGYWSTTWYKNNHISLNQTGELRLEMVRWGFPLEQNNVNENIVTIANAVRKELAVKYNNDLHGRCIEASEEIVKRLNDKFNLGAVTVEGWCKYDDEQYGSDRPWDPHTWVEIPSLDLYVDVTADQFNYGMFSENEYSDVIVQKGLPDGMQYKEPSWSDFGYDEVEDKTVSKPSLNKQIKEANNLLKNLKELGQAFQPKKDEKSEREF